MTTALAEPRSASSVDISSLAFWDLPFRERDAAFAQLRRGPGSWHPPLENPAYSDHGEEGFWAVTRAADIAEVSRDFETFSSAVAINVRPRDAAEDLPPTFMKMDPPEHTEYRRVLAGLFTPRNIATNLLGKIQTRAEDIIGRVRGAGTIDFVDEVSGRLPMLTIADLVGVPEPLVDDFARAGDNILGLLGPAVVPEGTDPEVFRREQIDVLQQIGVELVRARRADPQKDIATALSQTTLRGEPLTDDDIAAMMVLLSVAGNDTTKQTTSHVAIALMQNPDQSAWLAEDYDARIGPAVEEFVRYASPVLNFARTATRDTVIGETAIREGEKVAMFYCSGNRDETLFPDPHAFDLSRPVAGHVAFGGGGAHYCLGNHVAKAQLKSLFREIFTQLPMLEPAGEPELLRSSFIHGVRHLPVRVS